MMPIQKPYDDLGLFLTFNYFGFFFFSFYLHSFIYWMQIWQMNDSRYAGMITFAITIYKMVEKVILSKKSQIDEYYGYNTRKYIPESEMDEILNEIKKKINEEHAENKKNGTNNAEEKKKREKVKSGYIDSGVSFFKNV